MIDPSTMVCGGSGSMPKSRSWIDFPDPLTCSILIELDPMSRPTQLLAMTVTHPPGADSRTRWEHAGARQRSVILGVSLCHLLVVPKVHQWSSAETPHIP